MHNEREDMPEVHPSAGEPTPEGASHPSGDREGNKRRRRIVLRGRKGGQTAPSRPRLSRSDGDGSTPVNHFRIGGNGKGTPRGGSASRNGGGGPASPNGTGDTPEPKRAPAGLSLSGLSIRRPIGTLMLSLTVIVLAFFYLDRLPVDLLPSITYPRVGVRVTAPGVSPEVAEEEITRPLEEALSATEGVVQVYSQTREGQVSVDLFFQPGGNIDQALNDATAAVNRARGQLPDDIEAPRIFKVDPSQLPVYEFALTSPSLRGNELRVFADEELSRELSVVPGVAGVDVAGGAREEIRVEVDLPRLQSSGVGLTDVLNKLQVENRDISGGRLQGQTTESLTRTVGRFRSAEEIRNLSFLVPAASASDTASRSGATGDGAASGQRRVFLRDFATVIDGYEDVRVIVGLNREPAVKLSVQKQPDANTIEVVDGVKERISALRRSGVLPADTVITATLDEGRFIQTSVNDVAVAALVGAALAAASVLLFLGSLRQTFIIVMAIPLGTGIAVILMGLFGLSLNIFSLGGLAVGVGAVDSCIVVLENIVKGTGWKQGGEGDKNLSGEEIIDLSTERSRELESALLASTTTTLVAVVPFLLIGGFIALLFNELILTVSFTVAAALLTALTIVPMLTSRLLAVRRTSGVRNLWVIRAFNAWFAKTTERYGRLLERVLNHRLATLAIVFAVLGGGSVWMMGQIPQEILPRISTGLVNLSAQFPPGTPLETNLKVMAAVDDVLLRQKETEYVFSTAGGFLFGSNTSENPLRASSTITLKPGADVEAYVSKVNRELAKLNLVGIRLRLSPGAVRGLITSNSPVRGADVDIILQGNDEAVLQQAGRQVMAALDQQARLASYRPDADPSQPELQIRRDPERAAALGLSTEGIGQTIQTAIEGAIPTQMQRGTRLVDVRVRLNRESIQNKAQLERLPLFVSGGRHIRLSDVATVEAGQAPGQIQRINQRQVFIIAGTLAEGASLGQAIQEADRVIRSVDLPEGVSTLPSSAAQSSADLQRSLVVLGGLAIFLVFIVMAVQYDSLVDPLVILFTVPLALAGGIFGLYVTGTAIGATVLIGVVLLVGIVVGNGIIMVELANQIRERENIDRRAAILKAAPQRLRPIMMTTITTVLGLLPLALGIGEGSSFLRPLGIVVFWGLSLATLLTLFIVPCFYLVLHRIFRIPGKEEKKGASSQPGAGLPESGRHASAVYGDGADGRRAEREAEAPLAR